VVFEHPARLLERRFRSLASALSTVTLCSRTTCGAFILVAWEINRSGSEDLRGGRSSAAGERITCSYCANLTAASLARSSGLEGQESHSIN
jgi:hypothetical protein